MRGPETKIRVEIVNRLGRRFPGIRLIKIHGNMYQEAGITDLLGCYKGLFIAIEVKQPGEEPEPIQRHFIKTIILAGGIAGYVTSPKEAVLLVKRGLRDKEKETSHG